MLAYFHGPILVLMTANLVFFLLTTKNLLQTEKDSRMAGRQKKGMERCESVPTLMKYCIMPVV